MTIAPTVPSKDVQTQTRIALATESAFRLPPLANWDLSNVPVALMPIESIVVSLNGHGAVSDLDGLTASVQARGVLEPLIVTPVGRLLAGRRRLAAARRAGLTMVPVRVCEIADERTAIEIGLIENVERTDLDPLTRGKSYRALIEQGATVEEIAQLVGQGTGHVYQHLALLDLHPDVQAAVQVRRISFADARSLIPLGVEDQSAVLREIQRSAKPLSSRQVKAKVDARRVMRLVHRLRENDSEPPSNADGLQGNYAALFETAETRPDTAIKEPPPDPLEQINTLITEMVAAAQGEDQLRDWGRRLSHILELLRVERLTIGETASQRNRPQAVQDRLL